MSQPFHVLSVDGGGFRGLFAAHLLKKMEQAWGIDWTRQFGLMAGTSTGAILTAGLAAGISAADLTDFYKVHGKTIFRRRPLSRLDILRLFVSRYSTNRLKTQLERVFQEKTLGDIAVPLILPSVDIGNGCVHVLKSRYHGEFVRDQDVRVSDAVLASCSAPTYFDPYVVNDTYQLVDGGLWANNPSLVAAIDAHYRLHVPLQDIRVLSIGTGKSTAFYPRSEGKWKDRLLRSWMGWGLATRWRGSRLLDLILNLQADNAHNTLCLLLGHSPLEAGQVLRLTFESDRPLDLDSTGKRHDWIAKADNIFTHHATRIQAFLSTKGVPNERPQQP